MTADFSSKPMDVNGKRHNIFQVLKKKNCQPRILYTMKTSVRNEAPGSTDEGKLREFFTSRSISKEWQKEIFETERKHER